MRLIPAAFPLHGHGASPAVAPAPGRAESLPSKATLFDLDYLTYRTETMLYFVRKEGDAEVAARRIQIRLTGSRGQ